MKEPIISFVIPVYKKPAEIFRGVLKSLFDQSLKNIEVIACFDGPDAELQKVVAEFPKVQVYVSMERRGAPHVRNIGLGHARGLYVWFWDADCFIKPDHAKRMVEEFEAIPDADFVYSGYELAEGGKFESESFDAYSLQCGNFISSMAPIKREKAFFWDETLEAAQDWDYWLTAVEKGYKGVWVEGEGFITATYQTGLSSDKWSAANRDETIYTVRHKHGIPDRSIGVFSERYRSRAIDVAKILGADLIKPTGLTPTIYKTVMNIGYGFFSRFEGIADDVTKIQYWLPGEIEALKDAKYSTVMETIRVAKGVVNLCNTQYEQNQLSELGISTDILSLPLSSGEVAKVSHALPEKFSVLVATDEPYAKLLKELQLDLPHITFGFNAGKVADYSAFISFYQFAALDNAMLMALVNGRHVISNVQAPHTGFIDPDQTWETFKRDLYDKIQEVQGKPFNQTAQDHYLELADPEKFRNGILAYQKVPLEVL